MTLFSAATAAAPEHHDDGLQPGLYSYSVELEFTVKTNGKFAPSIVVKILAQLVLDEPDVVFVDCNGNRILIDAFPKTKLNSMKSLVRLSTVADCHVNLPLNPRRPRFVRLM
jgi:hypothetical protein